MKNMNKKINFSYGLTALITALTIAIFAPQYTWAMAPAASRTAALTGQLPARLAAQRAAQLAPALYPAAARLGLTGRSGTPAKTQENLELRNQQLVREQSLQRARTRTEQWLAEKKALEGKNLEPARARSQTLGQQIVGRRPVTGLTKPGSSPFSGSGMARPVGFGRPGQRSFTTASSRHDAMQEEIDKAEQRLPETLKLIDKTLKERYEVWKNQKEGKMSISEKLEFLADKQIERDEVRHWDPVASNSWGLFFIKTARALGYQTSLETKAIEKFFFHNKKGELATRGIGFSNTEIRAMRNFLAGLLTNGNRVVSSDNSKYYFKKGEGWIYTKDDFYYYEGKELKAEEQDRKYKTNTVADLNYQLINALNEAAYQADPDPINKHAPGRQETAALIAKLFLENPDEALGILTARYNIGQGEGFQYEKTGRTAYEQYQQEQKERTRSQSSSKSQSSRSGQQQQQSAPRNPLEAKFDADLADFEAGKKSYVDMVKAWHPDPEQDPAVKAFKTEKMKVINSARK